MVPAQLITTACEWDDLGPDRQAREKIEDIVNRSLREPGFRVLFQGPPGVGKTLAACLLGKAAGRPVYSVELGSVLSSWTAETEKDVADLLDRAQQEDWILFFDEAEGLFEKRTESRNANDRAANQQVAYLLQRIEDFPGIVILAADLRSHLDEGLARRLQSILHFPTPGEGTLR